MKPSSICARIRFIFQIQIEFFRVQDKRMTRASLIWLNITNIFSAQFVLHYVSSWTKTVRWWNSTYMWCRLVEFIEAFISRFPSDIENVHCISTGNSQMFDVLILFEICVVFIGTNFKRILVDISNIEMYSDSIECIFRKRDVKLSGWG